MAEFTVLKNKRTPIKAAVTRFKNYFKDYDKTKGLGSLPARLPAFESLYEKFDFIQCEIEIIVAADKDAAAVEEKERSDFENSYYEILSEVQNFVAQCTGTRTSRNQSSNNTASPSPAHVNVNDFMSLDSFGVKLPTITLPKFDGSFNDWLPFRDTFKSLIHNNSKLSNIQKFHYLNSALTGDAARVIQSLGVSDSNYMLAWNNICQRYEDSYSLVYYHTHCLFELTKMTKASHSSLRQLIDDTNNHLLALKSLGEATEKWDTIMVYLLTSKLDPYTKREWEKHLPSLLIKPSLKDAVNFLENHCKYLQRTAIEKPEATNSNTNLRKNANNKGNNSKSSEKLVSYATTKKVCPLCNENHALHNCEKFKKLPVQSRFQEVLRLRVCFNCLFSGHGNKQCTFGPCRKCPGKHNTLLHRDRDDRQSEAKESSQEKKEEPEQSSQAILVTNSKGNEHVMFGTAIVWVKDGQGNRHECRAILDSCSQVHLLSRDFCKRLKLPLSRSNVSISGVGRSNLEPQYCVDLTFGSKCTSFSANISCMVTPVITEDMPNIPLHREQFIIPKDITLADPDFANTRPVDLLISASLFWKLLCVGQINLQRDQPTIQKTQLGWIIAGPLSLQSLKSKPKLSCNLITNETLHDDVMRFWNIEHISSKNSYPELDAYDTCEQHFRKSTIRDTEGRFVISLPLKDEINELGDSLDIATKRFLSCERKLNKQPELKTKYVDFMSDYETQGHMIQLLSEELSVDRPVCYLPHHAVFKDSSTTTKVRVVFDGSAKTASGRSLNEVQYVGPVVQNDLFSIILRFRQHKIVLSADVTQMYRQIKVIREHQDLQRILWRSDSSQPIQHYRLTTVTFGTASAPFLATRALRQLGEENKTIYPVASDVIIRDCYVDDFLTGTESIEEAQQLKYQLTDILQSAGFQLCKWASNNPKVFENDNQVTSDKNIHGDKDPKTLGLIWNPQLDKLRYSVQEESNMKITKRTILSKTAQIFDPLGLVGPSIIIPKILLQKLWQLELGWDESLPQELHSEWINFSSKLTSLNDISVERRIICNDPVSVQLHGFSDASEQAYGACIYIRSEDKFGNNFVHLLCAKSRVAPLKNLSLPRLELQAALILAQLVDSVTASLTLKIDKRFFWCDSTITLHWILSPPSRWKTYVANRTSEIKNLTNNNWNHVSSEDNPADIISRGLHPENLRDCKMWWKGPSWLSQNSESWPTHKVPDVKEMPEERTCERALLVTTELDFSLLGRFSTLTRLIRVTAYCLRFYNNLKKAQNLRSLGNLQTQELESARTHVLKLAQTQDFAIEIKALKESKPLSNKNKLLSLNPFLDLQGLLRVGGRLANAPVSFNQKHPIILSSNNPITLLIIKHEHIRLLHAGCQSTMSSVRIKYWPLSCKNTVKNVIRQCVTCFRVKPVGVDYIMANLPSYRVTPEKPFFSTGVDYAGPFYIIDKLRSRVLIKSYLCVFVCCATKAVHLELSRDISTDAFLHCLQRFLSRRGICKHIYSDNGTNFVGARNEIKELYTMLLDNNFQQDVHDFLVNQEVSWHMIPPSAPHFGGLWESAVKSAKKHFHRVVGETRLTYEELYTVLTQVEACLNSRPLTPLSNDPNDLNPLTPGHFLTGDSLTALPQPELREIPRNRLSRYQHLQQMLQHFWHRWQKEYLCHLQERHKWSKSTKNQLSPGTMVILREDDIPPLKWRIGRITELHPGQDNVVRVVSVNLGKTILKRPVSKICILPIEDQITQTVN